MAIEGVVATASMREALVVLGAAAVVIPLFHRLRISAVLGFMLVGMAVGPSGLGALAATVPWLSLVTIADRAEIAPFAEFGVVLLLFMIGLELSFERIRTMRRLVFGLGSLQLGGMHPSRRRRRDADGHPARRGRRGGAGLGHVVDGGRDPGAGGGAADDPGWSAA